MDWLIIVGAILVIVGIVGSIIPALPGPTLSFIAVLLLFFAKGSGVVPVSALVVIGVLAVLLIAMDYIAPVLGAKFFGSTKYGLIGAIIGVVLGGLTLFPWGIFIGPFLGAMVGEMIGGKDSKKAAKAGVGTLLGSAAMTFFQVLFSVVVAVYFFMKLF